MKSLDHFITEYITETSKMLSTLGGFPFYVLVTLIFYVIGDVNVAYFLGIGLAIQISIGSLLRFFFFKERPNPRKHNSVYQKIKASSFPSMHITRFFFLGLTIYSQIKNNFLFLVLIAVVLAMAYSRISKKRHDLVDIIGGLFFALTIFYLMSNLPYFF